MRTKDKSGYRSGQGGRAALHSASAVRMMKSCPPSAQIPDPRTYLALDRRIRIRVASAAVLVTAFLVAVVAMGFSLGILDLRAAPAPSPADTSALTTRGFLEMSIRADGWDEESSTPVVVRVSSEDGVPVLYHAMKANARETVELEAGSYLLSFTSPVNADGGIYRSPGEVPAVVSAGHTMSLAVELTPVPPEEATPGDYEAIEEAVRAAVDAGGALRGEAGDALLSRLGANIGASPAHAAPVEYPAWEDAYRETVYYDGYRPVQYPTVPDAPVEADDPAAVADLDEGEDADAPPEGDAAPVADPADVLDGDDVSSSTDGSGKASSSSSTP